MLQTLPGALRIPGFLENGLGRVDIWLEQQVWGHRFYNDQTTWLLLLEAVNLMAFRAADKNTEQVFPGLNGEHENMKYETNRARKIRQILFTDRHIDEIANESAISDVGLWSRWFATRGQSGEVEFGYLKSRFATFNSFRNAVTLLRGCQLEPERVRRFTSYHLAPRGPAMLSGDYGEEPKRPGSVDKDRRFFGRGGELLYLMLNRSGRTQTLEDLVRERLLSSRSRWNRLATQLAPPEAEAAITVDNIGYMPMPDHRTYGVLADDWLALLSLDGLPDDYLSEPLMRLSALSVVRYIFERAADVLGESRPLMPIDAMGPTAAGMRKLARDALARHRDMTRKAVVRMVENFVASPEWDAALHQSNPSKAALDLLRSSLGYTPKEPGASKDNGETQNKTVDEIVAGLREAALSAHNDRLGLVPGLYSEQIGLAARRGSSRWYVLSDPMLEAVVLANVKEPMEFEAFLERLFDRYGFVIGTEVARRCYGSLYQQHVKSNQRPLEERLLNECHARNQTGCSGSSARFRRHPCVYRHSAGGPCGVGACESRHER
jgi:hypothetical protein